MALFHKLPDNVELLRTAAKELKAISRRDPENFRRIVNDIVRLGLGSDALRPTPPQGRKRLRSISAFQFDCGRFRVVYSVSESTYVILAIFDKPKQARKLRRWA